MEFRVAELDAGELRAMMGGKAGMPPFRLDVTCVCVCVCVCVCLDAVFIDWQSFGEDGSALIVHAFADGLLR